MKYQTLLLFLLPLIANLTRQKVFNLYENLGITYNKDIYSGYLETGVTGNEHFYILLKAEEQIGNRLLIYLDGGPGCSALGNFLTETGPVVTTLYSEVFKLNPHNWNKEIDVLYIDSPAGTGFSKTADKEQKFDDNLTANYHWTSIKNFFNEFTEYKDSDIYFVGESYGGVYVPHLIKLIYQDQEIQIKLKGMMIGNGVTHKDIDIEKSMVDFGYDHAIISPELRDEYNEHCPHFAPFNSNNFWPKDVTPKCNEIRRKIKDCYEGNDPFGLYSECRTNDLKEQREMKEKDINVQEEEISIWPSFCNEDMTVTNFLNSVKKKLGVDESINWISCNFEIKDRYTFIHSFDIYKDVLFKNNLQVWFYSGDSDPLVPTIGSMRWIKLLNMKIKVEFKQWKTLNQLAGFYQVYENGFTFITVKGAGHMPPQQKKPQMKYVLDAFLAGSFPE